MSKAIHSLSSIDEVAKTATCNICGIVPVKSKSLGAGRKRTWKCRIALRSLPSTIRHNKSRSAIALIRGYQEPHAKFKGDICERCGFTPEHRCQLDVHHLNGIHKDNRQDNLATLCANCHRWVTMKMREDPSFRPDLVLV